MAEQSKRMAGWILHLAIVCVLVAAALIELQRNTPKEQMPIVLREGYELADGRQVWLTVGRSDVQPEDLQHVEAWVEAYRDSMAERAGYVRKCIAEADYFLKVHAVQDEG